MNKSNCLHDFIPVKETKDGIVQVCKHCKYRGIYIKEPTTGRIDNAKYLKDHARRFAQPDGRTGHIYKKVQGDKKLDTYKPRRIAKQEARKGWEDLKRITRENNKTYV